MSQPKQFKMLPVEEVSMAVDPDEYAGLREKLRTWAQRQVERERRRKWLTRIVVAALFCVWLYWIIRILIRGSFR